MKKMLLLQNGLGCLIPASLILVPLNILALVFGTFLLIGLFIAAFLAFLLYSIFKECALSVKKLPIFWKVVFWLILTVFCFVCSCKVLGRDIGSILPQRGINLLGEEAWVFDSYEFTIWLILGATPLAFCVIGYLCGVYKAKKN